MSLRQVVLVANEPLSAAVHWLRFRTADGQQWSHTPGQWVNLSFPDEPKARRAYSIASIANGDQFALAVTHVPGGALSPRLCALQPGALLQVDGPHGFFTRDDVSDQAALFVATGSGIAPIIAMLEAAVGPGAPRVPLTLLFGCRTEQDILFGERLRAWADDRVVDLALHVTLSQPAADWGGLRGYVQAHVADLVAQRPVSHVYVCGMSAMVRAVRATLKPLGLGRGQVHTERYD